MLLNDLRQNRIASSIERPSTYAGSVVGRKCVRTSVRALRNRPYCNLPKCFRCRSRVKHSCRLRIHNGKCFLAISSIISAWISSPDDVELDHSEGIPPRKCDKLSNIGTNLVSSSMRGSIFAMCYTVSLAERFVGPGPLPRELFVVYFRTHGIQYSRGHGREHKQIHHVERLAVWQPGQGLWSNVP